MKVSTCLAAVRTPILLVAIVLLVSGCMLARQSTQVSIIAPEISPTIDEQWPTVAWAVVVQRPVADQMRDSDRILVRVARSRLQPYPEAAWLDSAPEMIQALLIQTLEDSDRFAGVGRTGGLRSRYRLVSEIRRFEAVDDGSEDLMADLSIQASLVRHGSGRVLATQVFSDQRRIRGKSLDAIIDAFEESMGAIFTELTGWVLNEGEAAADSEDDDERRDWRQWRR